MAKKKKGGKNGGAKPGQEEKKMEEVKTQAPAKNKSKAKGNKKKGVEKFATAEVFVNKTPKGSLKDFSGPMADSYSPPAVEAAWDSWWEKCGLYKPDPESKDDPFVVVIPPPNVTGTLHLGHALTGSIEDAVVRWNRMRGKNTLWVPGTDHAGIATQVVVEKKLMREKGISRHDLGREAFLKEVWKYKETNGGLICDQLRRLGCSVDWSREAFTMDDNLSIAVKEAFVRMNKAGIIYRANRLVSWSCTLKTAISAIEVDHVELEGPTMLNVPGYEEKVEFGVLHSFAYKFVGSDDEIVVATTRIETMLGDVAVAVHPDDPRYKRFVGKKLVHPFIPGRTMILITDDILVDMAFGTGAVKITPAHDPNDFECGVRHKLEQINVMDDDGNINQNGGKYAGMKRFLVREALVEELKNLGLYRGKSPNPMSIGLCSRSKDIIEPVIRPQWWVDCKEMARRSCEKVRSKELKIMPEFHEATWFRWLENIRDWCISRQLWWGHRIPAYLVSVKGQPKADDKIAENWVVARSDEEALELAIKKYPKVKKEDLILDQDEDVLDTWFSSGLFPFSVMQWPRKNPDLDAFFPNQLLETGHDILFFWVARMVMMSLQLTDQLPFTEVYLHAMVRDKSGRKMSKSLGNVIDPLDVMGGIKLAELHDKLTKGNLDPKEVKRAQAGQTEQFPDGIAECGADALRFGLLAYSAQGRDINLDIQRVVAYRQFCNKLWNATRFCLMNFNEGFKRPKNNGEVTALVTKGGSFADKWILHRLAVHVRAVNVGFEKYEFADVCTASYNFWLYDLCANYLEMIKPVLRGDNEDKKAAALVTLFACLEHGLRVLHPIMPFVTEELFHRLPGHDSYVESLKKANAADKKACGSIMVQDYPTAESTATWFDESTDEVMGLVKDISHASRSMRTNLGVVKERLDMFVVFGNEKNLNKVSPALADIATLSLVDKIEALTAKDAESKLPEGCMSTVVNKSLVCHFPLAGKVDLGGELIKLEGKHRNLESAIAKLDAKVSHPTYQKKTPADVQQQHAEKLAAQRDELAELLKSIKQFSSLLTPEQKEAYLAGKKAEAEKSIAKLEKDIAKLKKKFPKDKDPPKKTLAQVAAKEAEIAAIKARLGGAAPAAAAPAAKKEGKKKDKKQKGGKKGKKKGPSPEELLAKATKVCLKEGGKKGQDIAGMADFGQRFFTTELEGPAGDLEMLKVCMQGANKEVDADAEDRKGGAGHVAKFFFSYCEEQIAFICHIPKRLQEDLGMQEWVEYIFKRVGCGKVVEKTDEMWFGLWARDIDAGHFPMKLRDQTINIAFELLASKKLVPEDDGEELDLGAMAEANDVSWGGADY